MKNRIVWVDLARGFALFLVLLAHTPIPNTLSSYIYSFHLPLFFIVSGFLIWGKVKTKYADFSKCKVESLLVPYLFFSLITLIYWLVTRAAGLDMVARSVDPTVLMNGTFIAIRTGDFMLHNAALWFILSLFFAELLFMAIYKLVKGDRLLLAGCLLGVMAFSVVYNYSVRAALPWGLDTVPTATVFIGVGYFIREYYPAWQRLERKKLNKLGWIVIWLVVGAIFWCLNDIAFGKVDIFYSLYGNFACYYLAAVSTSMAAMAIFEVFVKQSRVLSYIGKNSLVIYALHQKVIFGVIGLSFTAGLGRVVPFVVRNNVDKIANGMMYTFLAIIIASPLIWLINRYLPWGIGKPKQVRKSWSQMFEGLKSTAIDKGWI